MCESTVVVDFRKVANLQVTFGIKGLRPKATPLVKLFSSTPLATSFAFTLGNLEYDGEFDLRLPTTQNFTRHLCGNVVSKTELRVVPNRATCFLDDFDSWLRDGQDIYPNITGLPINDESDFTDLVEAFLDESDGDYDEVVGWDCATRTVRWLVVRFVTDISTTLTAPQILEHYYDWDAYIDSLDAPPGVGTVLQVSDLWVTTLVLMLILSSTLESCMIAFGSSFLALCFFTGSARLAMLATFTVLAIVLVLFGFMCGMMEWSFGAVEAVSIIIFVGYCVDFVLHVAQAYHRSTATIAVTARARSCTNRYDPRAAEERALRVRDALLESGSAIISAAVTTTFSSVFLLGCTIIVFNKMGLVVCVATIVSLAFTLIAFTSVLAFIGPPPPPPKEKKPSILRRLFLPREAASKVAVAADDSPTSTGAGGWGESKAEAQWASSAPMPAPAPALATTAATNPAISGVLDELERLASRYREVLGTATLTSREDAYLSWRISRLDAVGSALRALVFQLEGPAPPNSGVAMTSSGGDYRVVGSRVAVAPGTPPVLDL